MLVSELVAWTCVHEFAAVAAFFAVVGLVGVDAAFVVVVVAVVEYVVEHVVVVVVVVVATSPDIFSDFFYFIPHLATVFMSYNYLELLGLGLAHLNY